MEPRRPQRADDRQQQPDDLKGREGRGDAEAPAGREAQQAKLKAQQEQAQQEKLKAQQEQAQQQ